MRTEDLPLDIKGIFDQKKLRYKPQDIARMRYACRCFVEFVAEWLKQ